jgi:hypothetical protein
MSIPIYLNRNEIRNHIEKQIRTGQFPVAMSAVDKRALIIKGLESLGTLIITKDGNDMPLVFDWCDTIFTTFTF